MKNNNKREKSKEELSGAQYETLYCGVMRKESSPGSGRKLRPALIPSSLRELSTL